MSPRLAPILAVLLLAAAARGGEPVRVIFDTDMGNDVDDAMALALLHALQSRHECDLLAVTLTKEHPLAGEFVDALNTFYGRGAIPVGVRRRDPPKDAGKFLPLCRTNDQGRLRYPHDLDSAAAPEAVALLRRTLAAQPDGAVRIIQVGFSSNLAELLDTGPDEASPLSGPALVRAKVRELSLMAGAFRDIGNNAHYLEYNVVQNIPAAKKLAEEWPTPIVWSGFEIGIALPYPSVSLERDFRWTDHHPVAEAYQLYQPTPHERPTWDLTAALQAVRPDRGYFELSPPGRVTVEPDGFTRFAPADGGRDRYLILPPALAPRTREALVQLVSQPP